MTSSVLGAEARYDANRLMAAAGPGYPVSPAGPRSTIGVCSRFVSAQHAISSLRANQTSFFRRM
jgi:hypothetical protein